MVEQKQIDKRMEAKTVVQLKHMLEMELSTIKEENQIDIFMFLGVDGRVFQSLIPPILDAPQFKMLNMVKANLVHICSQMRAENLKISIQQYSYGTVFITAVSPNTFTVSLFTRVLSIDEIGKVTENLVRGGEVLNHLFQQKPITEAYLWDYDKEVADELSGLTRKLFVDKFEETREYKRNMEIMKYLRSKVSSVVGVGMVDEVITLTMNELGTTAAYMDEKKWKLFTEMVINNHIKRISGDMVADECMKAWMPEVERKLKSFV